MATRSASVLLHITPRSLVVEGLDNAIVRKDIISGRMIDSYWDFVRMEEAPDTPAADVRAFLSETSLRR